MALLPLSGAFWKIRDREGTTPAGEPWVRYVRSEGHEGWYAVGSRQHTPKTRSFSDVTYAIAIDAGNERLDAVHAVGPDVLTIGGVAATGYPEHHAADLLATCVTANPVRFMEVMSAVMAESGGVHVTRTNHTPSGWCFALGNGRQIQLHEHLRKVFQEGALSRTWVTSISRLLRDATFDEAQSMYFFRWLHRHIARHARAYSLLGLPQQLVSAEAYTPEQRAVWSALMVMGTGSEPSTFTFLTNQLVRAREGYASAAEQIHRMLDMNISELNEAWHEQLRRVTLIAVRHHGAFVRVAESG